MSKKDNKAAFQQGLDIARDWIHSVMVKKLSEYGEILLNDADVQREYTSFTGNTLTSLAFGYYEDNNLTDVIFINKQGPVRGKIRKDEVVFLKTPYEGAPRAVKGQVETEDDFGWETSARLLQEYRPKGGNGIVVTTGTEYSIFLEQIKDMNVLSDTFLTAEQKSLQWMKAKLDLNKPIERL